MIHDSMNTKKTTNLALFLEIAGLDHEMLKITRLISSYGYESRSSALINDVRLQV